MIDLLKRFLARTPESFGAVGDGISDDTAAMQLAFDWVSAANGRQLISGPGTLYRITSTVTADFKGRKIAQFYSRRLYLQAPIQAFA